MGKERDGEAERNTEDVQGCGGQSGHWSSWPAMGTGCTLGRQNTNMATLSTGMFRPERQSRNGREALTISCLTTWGSFHVQWFSTSLFWRPGPGACTSPPQPYADEIEVASEMRSRREMTAP